MVTPGIALRIWIRFSACSASSFLPLMVVVLEGSRAFSPKRSSMAEPVTTTRWAGLSDGKAAVCACAALQAAMQARPRAWRKG